MAHRSLIGAIAFTGAVGAATAAFAFDESKYPDFSGHSMR
jgi:hypothetical protein